MRESRIKMVNVDLVQEECLTCHLLFWISKTHHTALIKSKKAFYCPSGHLQNYTGKTDAQKYQEVKEEAERNLKYYKEESEESTRLRKELNKLKKKKKKLKKKEKGSAPPKRNKNDKLKKKQG